MAIALATLVEEADRYLNAARISDYCPNGLQVEGRPQVRRIVSGVTASQALIEAAVEADADVLLVHHGYFWKGENPCITGMKRRRLQTLLANDISLLAYHLPLDAHPRLGNNAQLADRLGVVVPDGPEGRFGEQSLGFIGERPWASMADMATDIELLLGRPVTLAGDAQRPVRRIALCTGGAQSYFEAAIAAGADVFVTGEISEPQAHLAQECGVGYLACGHHATERYGAPAVGAHVAALLGLEHQFIEIPNPA